MRIPRFRSWTAKAVAALVVVMSSFGGLAVAGALPGGVQDGVANAAAGIGVNLPGGDDETQAVEPVATETETPEPAETETPEPTETETHDGNAQGQDEQSGDQGQDEQSGDQGQDEQSGDQGQDEQSGDQGNDSGDQSNDQGQDGGSDAQD